MREELKSFGVSGSISPNHMSYCLDYIEADSDHSEKRSLTPNSQEAPLLECPHRIFDRNQSMIILLCRNFTAVRACYDGVPKCATTASRTSNHAPPRLATS